LIGLSLMFLVQVLAPLDEIQRSSLNSASICWNIMWFSSKRYSLMLLGIWRRMEKLCISHVVCWKKRIRIRLSSLARLLTWKLLMIKYLELKLLGEEWMAFLLLFWEKKDFDVFCCYYFIICMILYPLDVIILLKYYI
jgi:hypothetical protein